ncbi:hypothetical protein GOP47_0024976 [Adiantum capillus-veneris]|uniref:VOC domain-containing protein n=1 Tax=Adiantum capillus-veneris TaxID=13818 RepID=A0A9D4U5E2_ADICA|nr:hypothetical protein GOP47_0024976 [Adiantum capillus-veneris]
MDSKETPPPLPISSVNHISLLCASAEKSVEFYERVLGFVPIKRPGSFNFDGAWLFNYGFGIHLIESPQAAAQLPKKDDIDPQDYHMSFQTACQDVDDIEECLEKLGVRHKRVQVEESGILVDQIFFHDPDGFMIEVCTCDNLPVVPLKSAPSTLMCHHSQSTFVCSQQYARCPGSSAAICSNAMTDLHETSL